MSDEEINSKSSSPEKDELVEHSKNEDEKKRNDEVSKSEENTENSETKSNEDLTKSYIYEGDKCIYVDPKTNHRYVWDKDKNDWVLEKESLKPFGDATAYEFDGSAYVYTDKTKNIKYKWEQDKNEWVAVKDDENQTNDKPKEIEDSSKNDASENNESNPFGARGVYGFENDTHTYTDPADNTSYIWDKEKSAWFPKVDDDFLAQYQMNYGFNESDKGADENKVSEDKPVESEPIEESKGEKRKGQPQEPTWFEIDEQNNTKVYVSNLPLDITETEFVDLMQKCGLVMKDLDNKKMKVKLYTEPGTDHLKGDGLCTYIKKESVDLALNVLDGCDFKGKKLRVERAKFTMKGNTYDPSLKPKKKKKKDIEKMKKIQEKLFDWRPDKLRGERSRNESVVIIKNLFEPSIFDKDMKLILEYQQDLRDECLKLGAVKRVVIYDRHPEGVAQINYKEPEAADACVQLMNGRWFNKRKLSAETWDGKTKYKIVESEEDLKKRLEKWESYLQSEEDRAAEEKKQKEADAEKSKLGSGDKQKQIDSDQETCSEGSEEEMDE